MQAFSVSDLAALLTAAAAFVGAIAAFVAAWHGHGIAVQAISTAHEAKGAASSAALTAAQTTAIIKEVKS